MRLVLSAVVIYAITSVALLGIRLILKKTTTICEHRAIFSGLSLPSVIVGTVVFFSLVGYAAIPVETYQEEVQEYPLIVQEDGVVVTINENEIRGSVKENGKATELVVPCDDIDIISGTAVPKIVVETISWKSKKLFQIMFGEEETMTKSNKVMVYVEESVGAFAKAGVALTRENGCKSRKSEQADKSKNRSESYRPPKNTEVIVSMRNMR